MNVLLTSDERCTYSSSLTPSFINDTSPEAKMLNLSKISCQDVIYLKNVDLLSTTTMPQILPRVLPPSLLLLLFEVGEFPLRSLSSHTGPFSKNTLKLNLFYCRQLSFCITSSAEEITFSCFSSFTEMFSSTISIETYRSNSKTTTKNTFQNSHSMFKAIINVSLLFSHLLTVTS